MSAKVKIGSTLKALRMKKGVNLTQAAAAAGMAFQFWIFGPISEKLGWPVVTTIWVAMVAVTALCFALALRPANKFKKENT